MNEEIVNRIAEILGSAGEAVVSEYTVWFIADALAWIAVAAIGAVLTLRWKTADLDWEFPPIVVKIVLLLTCAIMAGWQVSDLAAPRAIAIHQLLQDVRG